jgi:pimeloyl-ACP methyl ester carboxylesterase
MPHVKLPSLDLWYDCSGTGQPVLGIMGLGAHADYWSPPFVAGIAQQFTFVRFDNRGVGRSSGETAGVSIAMMADDAARLLDHLGIDRAHVIGVSMGGMITQELALRHPQRLITQTLCCTSPRPAKKRVRLGDVGAMLRTIATEKMAPILLSPEFQAASADKVRDFEARVASIKVPKRIILRQMKAAFRFDVTHRLQEIRVPTLVMTGDRDILIDHGHSDLLARSIQGAMLKKFPGAGHGFIVERYGEVLATLRDFWARHEDSQALAR